MINREMLENAAGDYDGGKYSEEFYTYHLRVLENTQEISGSVSSAVKYLFLWKLGKIRLKQTPSSSKLGFSDSKGRRHYSIPITKTHHTVIERAVDRERLEAAISFREGVVGYEEFRSWASNLTSSTIVLPAFYVHIWCPVEYPILDEKVWKVFCAEKALPVSRDTKPRSWGDFEAYTDFFKKLVDDTGLDWRTVDRGLWVLGDRLKKRIRGQKIKPFQGGKPTSLDYGNQEEKQDHTPIPPNLLDQACYLVGQKGSKLPFRCRGIMITSELIKATMELLNAEPTKTLPQNCRNDVRERTPDGLDRRIKERLNTDLRTANIISDVLTKADIAGIVQVRNLQTGRAIKGTKLLQEWRW